MKLLFLAYLVVEYANDPEFCKLLDSFSISIETFDRWWVLERHLLDELSDEFEKRLSPETVVAFQATGIPLVDAWTAGLRNRS